MRNKRNVFVTGAGGFIGANIVRALLKKKYIVHILNHHKTIPWRLQDIESSLVIHKGNITNFKSLQTAINEAQPNHIIHLATYGAYHYQDDMDKIIQTNIIGTKNLFEATKNIDYQTFINTGSSSEYGFKNSPMKETDVCDPVSYYAATKLGVTALAKVFAQTHNKPIMTFRLFSVYGPYEEPTRFIPVIMKSLLTQQTIQLTPGKQRRDFVYIDDVVDAYLHAIENENKFAGAIFNIGTGYEYTNDEIVKKLFQVTNKKTRIEKGAYQKREWDTTHWVADISKTKKQLGWSSLTTIDKGLENTYAWFEKNLTLYA